MSVNKLAEVCKYRDEILKAEIGALLFNLGKTHIGFWIQKDDVVYFNVDKEAFENKYGFPPFSRYKDYYEKGYFNLEVANYALKHFFESQEIKFPFESKIKWLEFFKGDVSSEDLIKEIFFGGCENLNSAIDKGAPNKQVKPKLWLSNSFGSYKREVYENDFDEKRVEFLKDFKKLLEELKIIDKSGNIISNSINWIIIRDGIFEYIQKWYLNLPSDSRFPINEITLWDQAFMTTSLFKAVIANLVANPNKYDDYKKNPRQIKWKILGIQYDKYGLADKAYKISSIKWYREKIKSIEKDIKSIIELECPLGNEIYRDETGIYFMIGEHWREEDLTHLKEKIFNIFDKAFEGEIYPDIVLSEPSRGLTNLVELVKKAKENFLKKERNVLEYKKKHLLLLGKNCTPAIGICPLCKARLVYKSDLKKNNQPPICETCDKRIHHKRVEFWKENPKGETIWINEIKDRNNKIALVTVKIELEDWINGHLLNSLITIDETFLYEFFHLFIQAKYNMKDLLSRLEKAIEDTIQEKGRQLKFLKTLSKKINSKNISDILDKITTYYAYNSRTKTIEYSKTFNELKKLYEKIQSAVNEDNLYKLDIKQGGKISEYPEILLVLGKIYHLLKKVIDYSEIFRKKISSYLLISYIKKNVSWKEFLIEKSKIGNLSVKNLSKEQQDFIIKKAIQEIITKNPYPARLRRIWEDTQDFMKTLQGNLNEYLKLPEWRKKRIRFSIELGNDNIKSQEVTDSKGIQYWLEVDKNTKKAELYLITSIEDFLESYGDKEIKKLFKTYKENPIGSNEYNKALEALNDLLTNSRLKEIANQLRQNSFKIELSKTKEKVEVEIKEIEFQEYKPFASITEPTPVGWQFIIPADRVPFVIDAIMEKYDEQFKYVYGKLPIHIGIVIQRHKRPLYIGLEALRRIRRDVDMDNLWREKDVPSFCIEQKRKLRKAHPYECFNEAEKYYALYFDNPNKVDYQVYIKPSEDWKVWISTLDKFPPNGRVKIIPNTFDFEYLDHNIRRNDIFYTPQGQRIAHLKENRPYPIEEYWEKFKLFKELTTQEGFPSNKLHKLVETFYQYLLDYEKFDDDKGMVYKLFSDFINLLELQKFEDRRKIIAQIFDLPTVEWEYFKKHLLEALKKDENLKLFLDMFEFWHSALEEV